MAGLVLKHTHTHTKKKKAGWATDHEPATQLDRERANHVIFPHKKSIKKFFHLYIPVAMLRHMLLASGPAGGFPFHGEFRNRHRDALMQVKVVPHGSHASSITASQEQIRGRGKSIALLIHFQGNGCLFHAPRDPLINAL